MMGLLFAAGVDAGRRAVFGSEPVRAVMMAMAAVAGTVNVKSLMLLRRLRNKDVNLRAATTFSFNDLVSNGGIIVGGRVVLWTGSNWPNLVIGIAAAGITISGGLEIIRDARREVRNECRSS